MATDRKYYTCKSAADRLEVAEVTVRQWCEKGKLTAIKFGRPWKIPVEVVETRVAAMLAGRGGNLLLDGRK